MMNLRRTNPVVLLVALVCGVPPAYALQGGPVMPEYVQFEPADAPDMVNLNTGNFSYTLPLSEVPGPYGGFPLAMSYHAGIGPNQEATWVGLGWTLNPGAINRSLRGVPDDQSHGGDLAFVYAHSATEVTSVNMSIPYGPFALNMSYNSMEGYGLNASVGYDVGILKAKASIGTDGFGLDGGVGVGMGRGGVGINGSLRYGSKGFSGGGGVVADYTPAQGVSLSASAGVGVSSSGEVASSSDFGLDARGSHVGYSTTKGLSASYYGRNGLGGSVNLNSHGYSASVSIPGAPGIGVMGASDSRSSSSDNAAGFNVSLFSYSRLIHQSWIRQATSEHSYGYMYQGGPAIAVDGQSDDVATTAFPGQEAEVGGDGSRGSIPWNWNFKGKSLDHVGNPTEGHLYPGYDVFEVASQGVSGAFRTVGLSRHEIFQSVEPLGEAGVSDNLSPNVLYYLLKQDSGAAQPLALRRQKLMDFDLEEDAVTAARFTRFAYDYCHDTTDADTLNVHYYGNQSPTTRFQKVKDDLCSRYAVLESNHLNEGNRLLFSRNPRTDLDLNKKFRSRMGFAFLGENGGYFESEDDEGSTKKGRDGLAASLLRKRIQRWKHSPYSSAMEGWEEPVFGARRIEPILEDNSNIGRLKGFKITNADGSQFFFTQPVRSLLSASYTTNQPMGSPAFVDRFDPRADDNVVDILRNTAGTVQDYPVSSWMNQIGAMLKGSVESFLFNSPDFKTPCDDSDQTHTRQYTFSYMMSTNPYATQWLLSEIRGADFVELNPGDMRKNFGYQVKFNYTEPAHYAWRTPYAPPGMSSDSLPNLRLAKNGSTPDNCLSELYHASFGVKELVYLKSIETATHKAEFHLNDLDSNPRIDGKGWVFNWQGDFKKVPNPDFGLPNKLNQRDSILNEQRLGIPILVGTHFPISKSVNLASADNQIAFLYRHDKPASGGYTPQFISNLRWVRYAVNYSIDKAFLDIQPTEEQIKNMKGRRIVLSGLSRLVTHDTVRFKAPVPSSDPTDSSYFALHGTQSLPLPEPVGVVPGYKVPAVAPASGFGQEGKILTAIVDTIVRAHGDELQFGSYKILFTASVPIGQGSLDSGFRLDAGISDSLYFANFDLENPRIPAANSPAVLKLTSGGGDFRGLANQPLLVFNSFVDSANEKTSNQMRYLTHVDLLDKQRPASPYKRFAFEFKNDIMPKTLNSYNLVDNDTADRIAQHRRSYPTSYDLNNPASDTTQVDTVLHGKLKLESVTEYACGGVDCSENLSLPPFRFYYQNPEATPFVAAVKPAPWEPLSVHAQTRMETIRMTGEKQDEWGFFNPNASSGNRKTTQVSADFGGAVWSLNRIVDPSGGVMDVTYERDTYYGEDYSDDRDALGMLWGPCTHNSSRVCLYFMPKKWVAYCDRRDQLQGDWVYTDSAADVGTEYVKEKGFVPGAEMLFNLQQTATTEVKCGLNLGFAKSGDCPRTRSVSVVGSAKIISTAMAQNVREPLFDAQKYYRDKANGNEIVGDCEGRGDCCAFPNPVGGDSIRLGQYWHCGYEAYRIETELSVDSLSKQFNTTVSKLKDRDWDIDGGYNERFGVAWTRRSSMVKGGDIRVRELVKHDIGLTQRTRYEYGVGQLAQYPDSVFSTAFATRFSTGKITDVLGTGIKHDYFKPFRRLPSQSRIPGIPDEDIFLLPGSSISYPKVTISNVIEKGGKVSVLNGKMEFEFHGPEQMGYLDIHIDSFTTASGLPVRALFADYFDSTNARIFTRDRFDIKLLGLQGLGNSSVHVYRLVRMDNSDPQGRKASHIRRVRFYSDYSGTEAMDDSLDIVLNQGTPASPKVNLYLKGSLSAGGVFALNRDPTQGVAGERHEGFDFPTPVLVKEESGDSVAYRDYTSRIGKAKATSYYRWLPDTAGQRPGNPGYYALIKRDSMVYASKAPSVDQRFIAGADSARVGRFKEVWSYARVRKCDSTGTDPSVVDCRDDKDTSQWKVYKDMPRHKTVTHTRFPTFLTRAKSLTGFTGSRQPDNSALSGGTDFITTSVTNHFFDPITGQPTLTVYHAGPTDGSPSKVTRMTPAYAADSGQLTTDLPMVMFAKNMLEANFRTDAFTFKDSTTVASFDAPSLVSGANGDNGGFLAPNLTAVTVTPYRHQFLSVVDSLPTLAEDTLGQANVTEPITNLGTFIPRFALSRAVDSMPRNRDLFTRKPGLHSWKGSHIAQVNRFLKPLEAKDAYGRITSNRFDPRGFHQTGLFGNAPYKETAVLTPDGFAPGTPRLGEWTLADAAPVLEKGYLSFGTPFGLWQPFDLSKNTSYVVECQLYSPNTTEIDVEFRDASGTEWALQTIFIQPGVRTYRVVLDSARWLGNPPPGGTNRLWVRSNLNGDKVGIKYLRAYPKKAEAMTYVYSERGDMIQSVDVSGVSTYFEYDLFGKLTAIRNDDGVMLTAGSREQTNQ